MPSPSDELEDVVAAAAAAQDGGVFAELGLVPCTVSSGKPVNATVG